MSDADRLRWDDRYTRRGPPGDDAVGPGVFAAVAHEFPVTGTALDLACGQGGTAVWLARRGLRVTGLDVSPVAVAHARGLADRHAAGPDCRFEVADLDAADRDGGLPPRSFDVIVCQRFRDPDLDAALVERLAAGGLLAVAALTTGRFGALTADLTAAFAGLDVLDSGTADGIAWLLARRSRIAPQ